MRYEALPCQLLDPIIHFGKLGSLLCLPLAHVTSCLHIIRRYMNLNDMVHIGDPSHSICRKIMWELDCCNNIVICTQQ